MKKEVIFIQLANPGAPNGAVNILIRKSAPDFQAIKAAWATNEEFWRDKGDYALYKCTASSFLGAQFLTFAYAADFQLKSEKDFPDYTQYIFLREAEEINFSVDCEDGFQVSYTSQ